jgi:hypothetical protein
MRVGSNSTVPELFPAALVACRHALLPKSSPSASRESRCASRCCGPSNSLSRLSQAPTTQFLSRESRSTAVVLRRLTHLGRGLRIRVRRCVRSWPGNAKPVLLVLGLAALPFMSVIPARDAANLRAFRDTDPPSGAFSRRRNRNDQVPHNALRGNRGDEHVGVVDVLPTCGLKSESDRVGDVLGSASVSLSASARAVIAQQ